MQGQSPEHTVVIGNFPDRSDAERAVRSLRQAGFSEHEIDMRTPAPNERWQRTLISVDAPTRAGEALRILRQSLEPGTERRAA
jgi:hypothetical protein